MMHGYRPLLAGMTMLAALAVAGCAADPLPAAPECETEASLVASEACEAAYACCTRACADTRSRSRSGDDKDCLAACASSLAECYRAIE